MTPVLLSMKDEEPLRDTDMATMRVYVGGYRTPVIQRDVNAISNQELVKYPDLADAATLEELRCWVKHKCFTRALKKTARNIMTSRMVAKWKQVKGKSNDDLTWIIRMRMALRGFQDLDKDDLDTYAGTAKRLSQRIVASE